MSPIRQAIIAEALSWEGTPYHAHACVKGVGVDCAMLLAGVAKGVGLLDPLWQAPPYSAEWHCHQREEALLTVLRDLRCQELDSLETAQPGDIVAFRVSTRRTRLPVSHVGILLPGQVMIHARYAYCVQRHRIATYWRDALELAFVFPGVEQ